MNWHELIDPAWNSLLCLTLLHSLWQVTLLTLLVWCVDRLCKTISVEQRYTIYVTGLILASLSLPLNYQWIQLTDSRQHVDHQSTEPDTLPISQNALPADNLNPAPPAATIPTAFELSAVPTATVQEEAVLQTLPARSATIDKAFDWRLLTPWIVALYLFGVGSMLLRLITAQIRVTRLRSTATLISEGPCVARLSRLIDDWTLKVRPVIACTERIVVPHVTGLLRPMILLPACVLGNLSPRELELILTHELAHIRRHDLWVNLLQRLAETVLFFNPALWYLSHRISVLREYCCDEMTCPVGTADQSGLQESHIVYSTALLRVAELAQRNKTHHIQLTSLSIDGKSPSEIRRRIARLLGEPLHEPPPVSRGSLCGLLILLAAIPLMFFVSISSAQTAEQKQTVDQNAIGKDSPETKTEGSPVPDTERVFQLTIVDPAGKPVPQASVEVRTNPAPTAKQVLRGEYIRAATYGPLVKTDDQGVLKLALSGHPKRFNLSIVQPGYGPYWAGWNSSEHPEAIPDKFTAQLEKGWTVGGMIVDEAGKPIKGAQVSPRVIFKKRPGDHSELYMGRKIKTDTNGQWQFDHVPVSKSDIHISVDHPEYGPWRKPVSRSSFEVKANQEPSQKIVLQPGLAITGSVTDENGEPISGALVRTKFLNDLRKATTDERGVYVLTGCEPRLTRVVVSAKGRALEMQEVRVLPDMDPVDFVLKPGGKIRVRVVDELGKGIPKARIFFQRWRGHIDYFEFDHISQYADQNGVWEWNEAPLDEFQADICRPGGMQLSSQALLAREKEYVFTPPSALIVSGRVFDAKTKQPIKKFRVTRGVRSGDSEIRTSWIHRDSFEAVDGTYRIRFRHDYPAYLIRIGAPGYEVAVSREIKTDEGKIDIDFALEPATDIAASILTPEGKPAANAKIAIGVKGAQINIRNGEIHDGSTYATQLRAQSDGRFSMPARDEPFQLIVTHPAGFVHFKSNSGPLPDPLRLTSWARVEGVFRIGNQPTPNIPITILRNGVLSYGDDVPNIMTQHNVMSGEDGHYVFERVWPGKGYVNRRITLLINEGATEATSAIKVPLDFVAGQTIHQDLGGTGRPVTGRLVPSKKHQGKVYWPFALLRGIRFLEPPPGLMSIEDLQKDPLKYREWMTKWKKSPAYETEKILFQNYQAARKKLLNGSAAFTASIARDGSFRIDDVPPGDYALSFEYYPNQVAAPPGRLIHYVFTVPPVGPEEQRNPQPVELGTLTLE